MRLSSLVSLIVTVAVVVIVADWLVNAYDVLHLVLP